MKSVTEGTGGAGKRYVADNSIVVCVKRKRKSRNQSLPIKEVRCENVQNPSLRGYVGDK